MKPKQKNPDIIHPHQALLTEMQAALKVALRQFGEYQFDDKGPWEVIELEPYAKKLRTLSAYDAADVIRRISQFTKHGAHRGVRLASALLEELQEWDELFDEPDMSKLL